MFNVGQNQYWNRKTSPINHVHSLRYKRSRQNVLIPCKESRSLFTTAEPLKVKNLYGLSWFYMILQKLVDPRYCL